MLKKWLIHSTMKHLKVAIQTDVAIGANISVVTDESLTLVITVTTANVTKVHLTDIGFERNVVEQLGLLTPIGFIIQSHLKPELSVFEPDLSELTAQATEQEIAQETELQYQEAVANSIELQNMVMYKTNLVVSTKQPTTISFRVARLCTTHSFIWIHYAYKVGLFSVTSAVKVAFVI